MVKTVPEIIITTENNPEQKEVQFSDMFALKDKITSVMFLWDFNSYYVNIKDGYFIINGGRRIQPTLVTKLLNKKIEYAKRNRMDIQIDGDNELEAEDVQVTYLVGIKGLIENEEKSILLHIDSSGQFWVWKDKR